MHGCKRLRGADDPDVRDAVGGWCERLVPMRPNALVVSSRPRHALRPGLGSAKRLLIGLALALGSAGCSSRAPTQVTCPQATYPPDQIGRTSITQGVAGNVWEWKGPFPQCGSVKAVVRTVLVYPLTPASAFPGLAGSAVFVDSFPVAPVDSTRSDSTGFFEVALPVGSYSLILREAGRLYVRTPTSNYANLGQADVVAGAVTARGLWLTYMASF